MERSQFARTFGAPPSSMAIPFQPYRGQTQTVRHRQSRRASAKSRDDRFIRLAGTGVSAFRPATSAGGLVHRLLAARHIRDKARLCRGPGQSRADRHGWRAERIVTAGLARQVTSRSSRAGQAECHDLLMTDPVCSCDVPMVTPARLCQEQGAPRAPGALAQLSAHRLHPPPPPRGGVPRLTHQGRPEWPYSTPRRPSGY